MRPYVFLGPSLPVEEARAILDAEYLPPIKRGVLPSLPREVGLVGMIDGVLMSESAVGHREILGLIDRGVMVIGGGSMGALRASELSSFGMMGVGRIYEEYSAGRIEGDDEVVLLYDPDRLTPLSEPLINLRLNLQDATDREIITAVECERLIQAMKRTYFPQRSYSKLLEEAERAVTYEHFLGLRDFVAHFSKDYKRIDAISVLMAVNEKFK